ncbi:hypothetical protein JTB14_008111 [Gonioctena quinquepunctata]|nr:hypothetical protein JTB14_008111 [Gonioctena quinquepunctata]
MKVATMDYGISGFRTAGIFPLNPDKFTAEDAKLNAKAKAKREIDRGKTTKVDIKRKRTGKEEKTLEENSDSSVELSLSDDNNSDTSEFAIAQRTHLTDEICIICGEFGKNRELWYCCVECGIWAHSECSGWSQPIIYIVNAKQQPEREEAKRLYLNNPGTGTWLG